MSNKKKGLGGAFADDSQSIPVTPKAEPKKTTSKKKQGKRSDPDYKQTGLYLKRSTLKAVKKKLADNDDLDMSEIADSLLLTWSKQK